MMSFARGSNLFALLEFVRLLDEKNAVFSVAEIIHAVLYIHSLGIVHCDLKLDNILIFNDGHLHLTDFGFSKFGIEMREFDRSLLFRFEQYSLIFPSSSASSISSLNKSDTQTSNQSMRPKKKNINFFSPISNKNIENINKRCLVGNQQCIATEILKVIIRQLSIGKQSELSLTNA